LFDEEAIMGSSSRAEGRHAWLLGRYLHRSAAIRPTTLYRVTDRLHEGRTVCVPGNAIRPTVSAWLAELGADSPLVEDLAQAVWTGDWPAVYAVGEHLSVLVAIAA
jgi:hypothetical protein